MTGYLEGLADDASVGDVFHDLYDRVEAFEQALSAGQEVGHSGEDVSGGVADPILRLERTHVPQSELSNSTGEGRYLTSLVQALGSGIPVNLLATTTFCPQPEAMPRRFMVRGFRGLEVGGDYVLKQTRYGGPIELKLGQLGLSGTGMEVTPRNLVGAEMLRPAQLVRSLLTVSYQRLSIVTDGIMGNIDATGKIHNGQDPAEVFSQMEKPIRDS